MCRYANMMMSVKYKMPQVINKIVTLLYALGKDVSYHPQFKAIHAKGSETNRPKLVADFVHKINEKPFLLVVIGGQKYFQCLCSVKRKGNVKTKCV